MAGSKDKKEEFRLGGDGRKGKNEAAEKEG